VSPRNSVVRVLGRGSRNRIVESKGNGDGCGYYCACFRAARGATVLEALFARISNMRAEEYALA
jgi:hypothetical protein